MGSRYDSNDPQPTPENVVQTALAAAKPEVLTAIGPNSFALVNKQLVRLPFYRTAPDRKMANVTFYDVADFIEYVKEQGEISTRIFATRGKDGPTTVTAIIDYHDHYRKGEVGPSAEPTDGSPRWGMHKASLIMEISEEFKPWLELRGKYQDQLAFAQFIDDNRATMSKPDPAAMSELALNLQGTQDAVFKSTLDRHNGNGIFSYEQTNTPKGSMEIPKTIGLYLPVIEGSKPQNIEINLQWRVPDGKPMFAWRIPAIASIMRDATRQQIDVIAEETGRPVWIGHVQDMQQPEVLR